MLLIHIFKLTKPSLDAFRAFGLNSRACQEPRDHVVCNTDNIVCVLLMQWEGDLCLFAIYYCQILQRQVMHTLCINHVSPNTCEQTLE